MIKVQSTRNARQLKVDNVSSQVQLGYQILSVSFLYPVTIRIRKGVLGVCVKTLIASAKYRDNLNDLGAKPDYNRCEQLSYSVKKR